MFALLYTVRVAKQAAGLAAQVKKKRGGRMEKGFIQWLLRRKSHFIRMQLTGYSQVMQKKKNGIIR
jgi:hypothetical protein